MLGSQHVARVVVVARARSHARQGGRTRVGFAHTAGSRIASHRIALAHDAERRIHLRPHPQAGGGARAASDLRLSGARVPRPADRSRAARDARRRSSETAAPSREDAIARLERSRPSLASNESPRFPPSSVLNPILTLLARTPREILPSRSTRRTWTPRGDRRRRSGTRSGRSNRSRRTS